MGLGVAVHFRSIEHGPALEWTRAFVERERFTGQIAFDLIETAQGDVVPIECNPRTTSGIHLLSQEPQITRAFLDPATPLVTPTAAHDARMTIPMLASGFRSRSRTEWRRWLQAFSSSRDVLLRPDDPLPALLAGLELRTFRRWARQHSISEVQAASYDLEWDGEELR
jgi:hypothetical protein